MIISLITAWSFAPEKVIVICPSIRHGHLSFNKTLAFVSQWDGHFPLNIRGDYFSLNITGSQLSLHKGICLSIRHDNLEWALAISFSMIVSISLYNLCLNIQFISQKGMSLCLPIQGDYLLRAQ